MPGLNDNQLLRYGRQILLPQIGVRGQERLLCSSALVVGAGGLGSPASMYLAAGGLGRLIIADDDEVELSNLQRQIVHASGDLGRRKTASASARLADLNPEVAVTEVDERVNLEKLRPLVAQSDVVLDCSDNFETRYALNRACWEARKPLVSAAAIRMEGQLTAFAPNERGSPCYQCLYPEHTEGRTGGSTEGGAPSDEHCATSGILSPLTGVIGSLQAIEAVKLLLGLGDTLVGRLLLFDAMQTQWREVRLTKNPDCTLCGTRDAA